MNNGFNVNGQDLDTYLVPRSYFNTGTLWAWGGNYFGGLGNNTRNNTSSPIQTVSGGLSWKQVANNKNICAGIKTDGSLWTWGFNNFGQMGDNTVVSKSSPVQTISGGTNWRQVSLGGNPSQATSTPNGAAAAVKSDGTLWTWGRNNYGQLGDNTTVNKSSPVQTVASGGIWNQVSTNSMGHTAAVKTDGTLWTWGYNARGQLGNNLTVNQSSPIQTVAGGTNWRSVAVGGLYTMAIKTNGTLWAWGRNYQGQLGDNTTNDTSSPIQTVAAGTNWKQVSASVGAYLGNSNTAFTAGIKTDGTLWIWGVNGYGQLGDNTTTSVSSPIQTIAAGTNWNQVSTGYNFTLAIKNDGTLWSWGAQTSGAGAQSSATTTGQLGDNTTVAKSSPIQTVMGGYNWTMCSAGYNFSAATLFINTFPP
jgi:alpha-tubulin suppressor-like RCC1 family protein